MKRFLVVAALVLITGSAQREIRAQQRSSRHGASYPSRTRCCKNRIPPTG